MAKKAALSKEEESNLQELLKTVFRRIESGRDMALFSWRTGVEPYERTFDQDLIQRAKTSAKKHKLHVPDAIQMTLDLINAGKIYVSTLVFNWYADNYFQDEYHPYGRDINIEKTRKKIEDTQDKVIEILPKLTKLMERDECAESVAINIFKMKEAKNTISRIAMQRAMGAFCKVLIEHFELI